MSNIFSIFDQDLKRACAEISSKLSEARTYSSSADEKNRSLAQVDSLLHQANGLIGQMDIDAKTTEPATRRQLQDVIRQYRSTVSNLQSEYDQARQRSNYEELMPGTKSYEDRQRLNNVHGRMDNGSRELEMAEKATEDMINTGDAIKGELANNRDKIDSIHGKIFSFMDLTEASSRVVRSMGKREVRQRIIVCFLLSLLIVAVAVMIYFLA